MSSILGMAAIRINGREIKTEGNPPSIRADISASSTWAQAKSGDFP
jgi:hypothetical protein